MEKKESVLLLMGYYYFQNIFLKEAQRPKELYRIMKSVDMKEINRSDLRNANEVFYYSMDFSVSHFSHAKAQSVIVINF